MLSRRRKLQHFFQDFVNKNTLHLYIVIDHIFIFVDDTDHLFHYLFDTSYEW